MIKAKYFDVFLFIFKRYGSHDKTILHDFYARNGVKNPLISNHVGRHEHRPDMGARIVYILSMEDDGPPIFQ